MKAKKYDKTGKQGSEVELPSEVFVDEYSEAAIQEIIRAELRNRRQGTHKTKTRTDVRGGGKKPYRQKGTGHARQGSTRAPQYRGGGTVFGPVPRDYSIRLSPKKRKAGLRGILSRKAQNASVVVIEDIVMESFSTKSIFDVFKTMGFTTGRTTVAFVSGNEDEKLKKSLANVPHIEFISAKRLLAPELYYSDRIVISESALETIKGLLKKQKAEAGAA